jgi:hypothetical protein
MKDSDRPLNKPFPSSVKGKKYSVIIMDKGKRKKVNFGDPNMDDFRKNKDPVRRKAFLARSAGIKNKAGKLTKNIKTSPNYWSRIYGWNAKI